MTYTNDIEVFFSQFPQKELKKRIVLLDPFVRPSGIYYLHEGFVRQYSISENGKELTIHVYGPGSHFPMLWALQGAPNRHHFQTMTAVKVAVASKESVLSFFKTHPESSLEFMRRLLLGIDGLTKRLEVNAFGSAYVKVISVLVYLSNHFGVKKGLSVVFQRQFTHEEIATISGLTREHVSLELEKLQEQKLITITNHQITILKNDTLISQLPFNL